VEQVENKVPGTKDKVEELDQTVKDYERMLRKYEQNMQDIWDTIKRPNLQIMGVEEGKEIQTKGIDNLFNRIIAEKFPNLKKESPRCRKFTKHQTIRTKKETPQTYHNQNTQHTEQRKNSESCKTDKLHIKVNTLE
jgi:hypothetical protein